MFLLFRDNQQSFQRKISIQRLMPTRSERLWKVLERMKTHSSMSSADDQMNSDKYVVWINLNFRFDKQNNLSEFFFRICLLSEQIIQRTYKTSFGKDLIEDIRSETSGNFEKLLVALLTPIVDYYVKELYDAMAGIGTDEVYIIWNSFSSFTSLSSLW